MKKYWRVVKCVLIAMSMTEIAYAGSSNWTGFYAGLDAGVAFNHAELTSQHLGFTSPSGTCQMNADDSTFFPGIQLGYMHQFAHAWVAGMELNTTFNTNQKQTLTCESEFNPDVYDGFTFKNQMQTAIKVRVARALSWDKTTIIPYVTAGASFAHLGLTYQNEGGDYDTNTSTEAGWLIGAGLEWAFLEHWSLRAEYNYMDYGNAIHLNIPTVYQLFDNDGDGQINLKSNTLFMAISYWI